MKKSSKKKVFLCHSKKDIEVVYRVKDIMNKSGINIWIDELEIGVSDSLFEKIGRGIEDTDYLIIFLSKSSSQSNWVTAELEIALKIEIDTGEKIIFPVLIEDCKIPKFISARRYADLRNEEKFESEIEMLIDTIKKDPSLPSVELNRSEKQTLKNQNSELQKLKKKEYENKISKLSEKFKHLLVSQERYESAIYEIEKDKKMRVNMVRKLNDYQHEIAIIEELKIKIQTEIEQIKTELNKMV